MKEILTQSKEMSHEYCCTVVRLGEILPIEGAETVAKTLVNGREIVIGKDHREGDIMIYASNECQLCHQFMSANNLFEDYTLNSNRKEVEDWIADHSEEIKTNPDLWKEYKRTHCGYFERRARVRMKKLCKTLSMGFLFDVENLEKWKSEVGEIFNWSEYVGTDFDTVAGELLVKAYVPLSKESTPRGSRDVKRNKKLKKFDRMIPGQFAFHYDTQQFERCVTNFKPEDEVTISVKLHGCVEENTIIDTLEFGEKTIGEIVNGKINCHIKAHDVDKNEDIYVPVDEFYLLKNDGEWYEVELENGQKITITGNNPVWIPTINAYRRVDELEGDEFLLLDI